MRRITVNQQSWRCLASGLAVVAAAGTLLMDTAGRVQAAGAMVIGYGTNTHVCEYPAPLEAEKGCCDLSCMVHGDNSLPGLGPCPPMSAHPVDLRTGHVYENVTDLSIPSAGLDVIWSRSYSPSGTNPSMSSFIPNRSYHLKWEPLPFDKDEALWNYDINDAPMSPKEIYLTDGVNDWLQTNRSSDPNDYDIWFNNAPETGAPWFQVYQDDVPTTKPFILEWPWGQKATFVCPDFHGGGAPLTKYEVDEGLVDLAYTGGNLISKTYRDSNDVATHFLKITYSVGKITVVSVYEGGAVDSEKLVAKVEYTYHDDTPTYNADCGLEGDLLSAKVYQQTTEDTLGAVSDERETLYRYHDDVITGVGGGPGTLKMIFRPESTEQMRAYALSEYGDTPFEIDDEYANTFGAKHFADYYFEYSNPGDVSGEDRYVSKEIVRTGCSSCGGSGSFDAGEFTYAYHESVDADRYWEESEAAWFKHEVVVTRPDGNKEYYFIGAIDSSTTNSVDKLTRKIIEDSQYPSSTEIFKTEWTFDEFKRVIQIDRPDGTSLQAVYDDEVEFYGDGFLIEKWLIDRDGNDTILASYEYDYNISGTNAGSPPVVTKRTVYPDGNILNPVDTILTYTYSGTEIATVDTSLPAIDFDENGEGIAAGGVLISRKAYNSNGSVEYILHADGRLDYFVYDDSGSGATGLVSTKVLDLDHDNAPGSLNPPALPNGWTARLLGANFVTTREYDGLGRPIVITQPDDLKTHLVYLFDTTSHQAEIRVHSGWTASSGSGTSVLPTNVVIANADDKMIESFRVSADFSFAADLTTGYPLGTDTIANSYKVSRDVTYRDEAGAVSERRVFYDANNSSSYTSTKYTYGLNGRLASVTDGEGTITEYSRDALNRIREIQVGTDNSGDGNDNMVTIAEYLYDYDTGADEAGYLKTQTLFTTSASIPSIRVLNYTYDARGRRALTLGSSDSNTDDYAEEWVYDNLDRETENNRYSTWDTTYSTVDTANLIVKRSTFYDPRGRIWKEVLYDVGSEITSVTPPGGGGNAPIQAHTVKTYAWYNDENQLIKRQTNGLAASKWEYDDLGRVSKRYITDAGGDVEGGSSTSSHAHADDVTGDKVLEQTEFMYFGGEHLGRLKTVTRHRRDHDATATGALTASTGRLNYTHLYYDTANRRTHVASYGTNGSGETSPTYQTSIGSIPATARVNETIYHSKTGAAYRSKSPDGKVTQYDFDDASRVTHVIENRKDWDGNTNTIGGGLLDDEDRVTAYTYNDNNDVETVTAYLSSTTSEVTNYVYGVTKTPNRGTNPDKSWLTSNSMLHAIIFPDSDDPPSLANNGTDSTYDRVELAYDVRGKILWMKDPRGVIREFEYNDLGRRIVDKATTIPTGVDTAVKRIERQYNPIGLLGMVTSRSGTGSTDTIVNQVQRGHSGFGQLQREWPEHSGAVDTSTLQIAYTYDYGTTGDAPRLSTLKYPQGSSISYEYDTGIDADISRISGIEDGSNVRLADYSYLGVRTPVIVDYVDEPEIRLDYTSGVVTDESDTYNAFDRFGRVTTTNWLHTVPDPLQAGEFLDKDVIKIGHTYDIASNRISRDELIALPATVARDELYTYDGLNRLIDRQVGIINDSVDPLVIDSGDLAQSEAWEFDSVGNMTKYELDGEGDGYINSVNDLSDSRTFNGANEITAWDPAPANSGNSDLTPTYDRAGNITDDKADYVYTYNAWNQLVKVENQSATTIGEYAYDGLGRRIEHTMSVESVTEHEYYTEAGQRIESRPGGITSTVGVKMFVYGVRFTDDIVMRIRDANESGPPEERRYYLTDSNYNVVMTVDDSGRGSERIFYNGYGQPEVYSFGDVDGDYDVDAADRTAMLTMDYNLLGDLNLDGEITISDYNLHTSYQGRTGGANVLSVDDEANDIGFSAALWNDERAQWHMRDREMAPKLGRFLQRDRGGYGAGMNLYESFASAPSHNIDPTGFSPLYMPIPEMTPPGINLFLPYPIYIAGDGIDDLDLGPKSNHGEPGPRDFRIKDTLGHNSQYARDLLDAVKAASCWVTCMAEKWTMGQIMGMMKGKLKQRLQDGKPPFDPFITDGVIDLYGKGLRQIVKEFILDIVPGGQLIQFGLDAKECSDQCDLLEQGYTGSCPDKENGDGEAVPSDSPGDNAPRPPREKRRRRDPTYPPPDPFYQKWLPILPGFTPGVIPGRKDDIWG